MVITRMNIEGNYFEQEKLTTKPGQYRETTIAVDSFSPNAWGLYNMHGNVSEWVWDYYGAYDTVNTDNPAGAASGTLKVYRGGGWNDFAKNMRNAYRATLEPDSGSFNIGMRLVRNAVSGSEDIVGVAENTAENATNAANDANAANTANDTNTANIGGTVRFLLHSSPRVEIPKALRRKYRDRQGRICLKSIWQNPIQRIIIRYSEKGCLFIIRVVAALTRI